MESPLPRATLRKRMLVGLALAAAGLVFGAVLLTVVSMWSARRELHSIRTRLASFRVFEVRYRMDALLPPADRDRAKRVFDALDAAALEGRIDPIDLIPLRADLDRVTSDSALDASESEEILDSAARLTR